MALIRCEDCGKEVSDRAPVCPGCGAPIAAAPVAPAAHQPAATPAAEQELLSLDGVTVTTVRVISPGQTYAMSGITSVGTTRTDASPAGVIALVIVGGMFIICGGGIWESSADKSGPAMALIAGLGALVGSFFAFRGLRPTYHIVLRTAGGEVQAFHSHDLTVVNRIVHAINQAMVARG